MLNQTKFVLDRITELPHAERLLLVGGTALSIHTGHRFSEDLDFAFIDNKLPRASLRDLVESFRSLGLKVESTTSNDAIADFENDGLDILDYQQDYLFDGVKVTFFKFGDSQQEREDLMKFDTSNYGKSKILGLDGLFMTKCLALCDRMKSRDLFDLWWYTSSGRKNVLDIIQTIQHYRSHIGYDEIRKRLLDWPMGKNDEGFNALISSSISVEEIRQDFRREIDPLEISMARDIQQGVFKPS